MPDAQTSPEVRKILQKQINAIIATLKVASTSDSDWIDLGIGYKGIGDYEGAKQAWEYVSYLSPKNIISFINLGDLYHYYLHDYPKAEYNLLKVIENNPTYVAGYRNLFDLYHLSYKKDTNKAEATLLMGLKVSPRDLGLLIELGDYYKEKKQIDKAKDIYTQALSIAEVEKNQDAINYIDLKIRTL